MCPPVPSAPTALGAAAALQAGVKRAAPGAAPAGLGGSRAGGGRRRAEAGSGRERPGLGKEGPAAAGGGAGGHTSLSPAACLRGAEDGGAGGPATAAVVAVRQDRTGPDRTGQRACAPRLRGGRGASPSSCCL